MTLLFGTNPNVSLGLGAQLRLLQGVTPRYDHLTLVTPDVQHHVRSMLEALGTRCVPVDPVETPSDMTNKSVLSLSLQVIWSKIFTKLIVW